MAFSSTLRLLTENGFRQPRGIGWHSLRHKGRILEFLGLLAPCRYPDALEVARNFGYKYT
jgi:hypothetical protein